MVLKIVEFGGFVTGPLQTVLTEPPIQVQSMTGATTAAQTTITLSATTRRIALQSDTVGSFFAIGSSTASTANNYTSTNSERLGANSEVVRYVLPSARIIASST
jgi:hypothetical protein